MRRVLGSSQTSSRLENQTPKQAETRTIGATAQTMVRLDVVTPRDTVSMGPLPTPITCPPQKGLGVWGSRAKSREPLFGVRILRALTPLSSIKPAFIL